MFAYSCGLASPVGDELLSAQGFDLAFRMERNIHRKFIILISVQKARNSFMRMKCLRGNVSSRIQWVILYRILRSRQGCDVLDSDCSGWLNSNSCDIPGDSTLTQLNTALFEWLNSDSTKIQNLITWLNSDLTHFNSFESELNQMWLTTHHLLHNFAKTCLPGGAVERSRSLILSCYGTDKCKILTFPLQKSVSQLWLKQHPVDSTLT